MADFNVMFLVLFILVLTTLSITNFADKDKMLGRNFFALIYLIAAILLAVIGWKNV